VLRGRKSGYARDDKRGGGASIWCDEPDTIRHFLSNPDLPKRIKHGFDQPD
jgi:hypothetical protein